VPRIGLRRLQCLSARHDRRRWLGNSSCESMKGSSLSENPLLKIEIQLVTTTNAHPAIREKHNLENVKQAHRQSETHWCHRSCPSTLVLILMNPSEWRHPHRYLRMSYVLKKRSSKVGEGNTLAAPGECMDDMRPVGDLQGSAPKGSPIGLIRINCRRTRDLCVKCRAAFRLPYQNEIREPLRASQSSGHRGMFDRSVARIP